MDQDIETPAVEEEVEEPTLTEVAAEEAEGKRGPILTTLSIRVTIRDDVFEPKGDAASIPTNDAVAELVEIAFARAGYQHVNATAEKV